MKNPPGGVKLVMEGVCIMLEKAPERKIDPSTQKPVLDYWPTSVRLLADMDFRKVSLLFHLLFNKANIFSSFRIYKPMIKIISNRKSSNKFVTVLFKILHLLHLKLRKFLLLVKVYVNGF
jgi:hypothetical protein